MYLRKTTLLTAKTKLYGTDFRNPAQTVYEGENGSEDEVFEAGGKFKDNKRLEKLRRKIEESFDLAKRMVPGSEKPGSEGRVTATAVQEVYPFFEVYGSKPSIVHYYDNVPEIDEMMRAGARDLNNKTVLRCKFEGRDRAKSTTAFHLYSLDDPVLGKRRRAEPVAEEEEDGNVSLDTATQYRFVREYRYTRVNEGSQ